MRKFITIFRLVLLLLILSTFNPNSSNLYIKIFPIQKVEISNLKILDSVELENYFLNNIEENSLFFFKDEKINKLTKKYELINSVEIKKIFPNKVKLKIFEKIPIGILYEGKRTFYITKDGDIINFFKNSKLEKLPIIYGKGKNFINIYNTLIIEKFPLNEIKAFYFFEIGRWDIILKNKKIIKLPPENFDKRIKDFIKIMNHKNFDKYTIFDYRIKKQLILN
tara:strand:- start:2075 stop:2743 length:669 start_codon:yes stop_codon:yes gene_type:complete